MYQILVPIESILVPTGQDTNHMTYSYYKHSPICDQVIPSPTVIEWYIGTREINQMDQMNVLQRLIGDLAEVALTEVNGHLWTRVPDPKAPGQRMID
jgi:hypothetical protein